MILKHELIAIQLKLENAEKKLTKTKKELSDSQKKNVHLEAQIKASDKKDKNTGV